MTLRLEGVSKVVGRQTHIHPTDLELKNGTMNVLLGPTLSGKTTLMRLMAGLDVPHTGRVFWNDEDVTGVRVQKRNVAMVYQQFINYPSITVYENIASPLRLAGKSKADIDAAVRKTADLMKLGPMLERKPLDLVVEVLVRQVRRGRAELRTGGRAARVVQRDVPGEVRVRARVRVRVRFG